MSNYQDQKSEKMLKSRVKPSALKAQRGREDAIDQVNPSEQANRGRGDPAKRDESSAGQDQERNTSRPREKASRDRRE